MTMPRQSAHTPFFSAVILLTTCLFLLSCGSPENWAEQTFEATEADALLHAADKLRRSARRAVLRSNDQQSNISYNEAPYAIRPVLVFTEVPKSKYDDRTLIQYHSVNSRLPTDMVAVNSDAVGTFIIAASYREAGKKTRSTLHGREVLDLFDYHDITRFKLIDRETGRYTTLLIRSADDAAIAAALNALPGAPPHPDRISDYFGLRDERVKRRRDRLRGALP